MSDLSDAGLLERFVREGSEEAFAALVERYIALVHSVALRNTDNQQNAEDIRQAVFIILARRAGSLGSKVVVAGCIGLNQRSVSSSMPSATTLTWFIHRTSRWRYPKVPTISSRICRIKMTISQLCRKSCDNSGALSENPKCATRTLWC